MSQSSRMSRSHVRDRRNPALLVLALVCLSIGMLLMAINLYGLTQPIRKPGLGVTDRDQLRFGPEEVWNYQQSMAAIDGLAALQSKNLLAEKANDVVNKSLIHVQWNRVDPLEYRQLVPVWENYFLWAIGRFSGLPQFERYHYADYRRNIRRGIGICGDASTILSSVMDRYEIPNRIVSFHGHVIVEYENSEGERQLLDPDFGVSLGMPLEQLIAEPAAAAEQYLAAGYSEKESSHLVSVYQTDYAIFDDTYHFMSKRYLFEKTSYVAKWLLPIVLIALPVIWLLRTRRISPH